MRLGWEAGGGGIQKKGDFVLRFVWFEGYDEIQHVAAETQAKVQQHKQNRAR